jgi:hypothetical protein
VFWSVGNSKNWKFIKFFSWLWNYNLVWFISWNEIIDEIVILMSLMIFWIRFSISIGTSATIGSSSSFIGTILAHASVTFGSSSVIVGRALAYAAVSFESGSAMSIPTGPTFPPTSVPISKQPSAQPSSRPSKQPSTQPSSEPSRYWYFLFLLLYKKMLWLKLYRLSNFKIT